MKTAIDILESSGKSFRFISPLIGFFLFLTSNAQAPKWEKPEREDPEIFEINRETPTASFYRYETVKKAQENESWGNSPFYQSLNGKWDFKYVESAPLVRSSYHAEKHVK